MSKSEFKNYLCLPFCTFYKPEAKEELLCRGARLVDRLMQNQRINPGDLEGLSRDEFFSPGRETDLEAVVCEDCPFRLEDCDFKSIPPPEDSRPCGGLLLLKQLISKGSISLQDLSALKD